MMRVSQNRVAEITLVSDRAYDDPFREVDVRAHVTGPDGNTCKVPAFWAGGNTWKVRYSSDIMGRHRYVTECSDAGNPALHGVRGEITVTAYRGDNPLYRHGPVARLGNDRYLSHRYGAPFLWLGDTWWFALTARLSWPGGFRRLLKDRVRKGFNVVQIVAGLYPDMRPCDERGANEAGFPWDEGFRTVNPAYFDYADRRIACLAESGVTPCVVGCWGYYMDLAGKDAVRRHWQYLIARWGAYPVVWCLAGEANMPFYGETDLTREQQIVKSRRDWNDIAQFVRQADPFRRLVTIHPTAFDIDQIEDPSLLDLCMLQTGHESFTSIVPTMRTVLAALDRKAVPVLDAEVCYEGICGGCHADVQRYLFWMTMLLGACGFTYGANGLWQFNTAERPYGASPHGVKWGDLPWTEACNLPGSYQLGKAARFLSRFEWWRFERHPEWVDHPCSGTAMDGCFSAGIPGEVRVIYRPLGFSFWNEDPIRNIEPGVTYRACYFDPVTGAETDLGLVRPDQTGTWVSPRVHEFHDWVIALVAEDTGNKGGQL